jgi:Flp pilus assembly protein TadG
MKSSLPWRLARDESGTSAVEFAIVVPTLFTLIFSLMEADFALFNFQQIQAVASDTARCMAIGSSLCSSGAATYAINMSAPGHAVGGMTASMVTSNTNATCGSQANMTKITIAYPLAKALPLNFIPSFMNGYTLTGIGCFPNIS